MTLTTLGPVAVVGGFAAIAAVLYLLQRLRVRHREVEVVTTLFWRQAVEERRARVFTRRFRHPLAYGLLLLIAGLLWLLIAGPRLDRAGSDRWVVLVDGSARLQPDGRFDVALAQARALAAELPPDRRAVCVSAGVLRTVLAPGEALPLFDVRVRHLAAAAAPSDLDGAVRELAAGAGPAEALNILVVGDDAAAPRGAWPGAVHVETVPLPSELGLNRAFAALGAAEAASGRWDAVDVYVATTGDDTPDVSITLDGVPLDGAVARDADGGLVLRDIPARGGTVAVALSRGGSVALDDTARLTLPDRPPIAVHLDVTAPDALRRALSVDDAVRLVDDRAAAEVRIGFTDEDDWTLVTDLPTDAAAIRIATDARDALDDAAARLIDELAIAQIDAVRLADQTGVPIRLDVTSAPRRRIRMWSDVLDPTYDFARSRACPLFVAAAVRWLAGRAPLVPWVAAGEPIPAPIDAVVDRAIAGGEHRLADGRPVAAALLERRVGAAPSPDPSPTLARAAAPALDLLGALGVLVTALLVTEWLLFARGRVP